MPVLNQVNNNQLNLSVCDHFDEYSRERRNNVPIILQQLNGDSFFKELFMKKIILDLGANVGLFSMFIAPVASKVFSLEPTPSHFEMFVSNIVKTGITNIVPLNYAISTTTGSMDFFLRHDNSTMNSLMSTTESDKISVLTISLQDIFNFLNIPKIDLIKMDIEGFETTLVTDERFLKATGNVMSIYIEVHDFLSPDFETYTEENCKKIIKALDTVGFKSRKLSRDTIYATK